MKYHLKKISNRLTGQLLTLGQWCCLMVLFAGCGGNDGIVGPVNAEEFSITVESNLAVGAVFGVVSVSNNTGLNLTYVLESQTPDGAIAIDPTSGTLSVASSQLFNEDVSPIQAIYTAISENGERDTAPITITVLPFDPSKDRDAFITTWRTSAANETITIPTFPGLIYNFNVDWGDGFESLNQTGNAPHTYSEAGTYEVQITGSFPSIYINFGFPLRQQIQTIEQWGNIEWETMRDAFEGCSNLTYNATDVPDLSNVTDMSGMFRSASRFNGFIGNWDVSNVTDMSRMFSNAQRFNRPLIDWNVSNVLNLSSMFESATQFNQPIDQWDVSNVTNMSRVFFNARNFNQPLNDWDVSNAVNMTSMFQSASQFNQPIDQWDVGNASFMGRIFLNANSFNQPLNVWNVSNVVDMNLAFFNARSFNQPLNDWDVSSVTNMSRMFESAIAFNQPLNNWDVSSVTQMWRMFVSNSTFNQDLSGWDVTNVTFCADFNVGGGVISAENLPNFTNCNPN